MCRHDNPCRDRANEIEERRVILMILEVKGQVFPKVWKIAESLKKLREERRPVNLGSNSISYNVYLVELPPDSKISGNYIDTPQGVKLYYNKGDQYTVGYLISEIDDDPLAKRHFSSGEKAA